MPLQSAFWHFHCFCFHPLYKQARLFSVGPLTDILGLLSSIMFSSVHACPLGHAAGVLSVSSTNAYTTFSSHISACLQRSPAFSLKVKLKSTSEKGTYLQFRTHFSFRQEIYCRLSIVRCWQIPHIFHIRPPETWGCFKTQGTSSTKTLFDLRSTGRHEPNIHSVFYENIFSDINAISPAINHLRIHLKII